jgi:hypothetical protein
VFSHQSVLAATSGRLTGHRISGARKGVCSQLANGGPLTDICPTGMATVASFARLDGELRCLTTIGTNGKSWPSAKKTFFYQYPQSKADVHLAGFGRPAFDVLWRRTNQARVGSSNNFIAIQAKPIALIISIMMATLNSMPLSSWLRMKVLNNLMIGWCRSSDTNVS